MSNPLVSILITTFNSARYIREALDSALAQTYQNFEIVVVDGGSTDGTRDIIRSYIDPRLRPIFSERRLGIKEGRNLLFREARGEFLTFLDSDDIYLPEKVAEEAAFLRTHLEYAAAYCDLRYFYDGAPEKLYRHRYVFHSGDIFRELLTHMFITNTTVMFRRSVYDALGGYDEALGMVEDWEYFLRMAHAGYKIGFIPRDLVRFRLRWDNNTRFENQREIQESALNIFERLRERMTAEERRRYSIDAAVARRKIRVLATYLAEGKRREAWRLAGSIRPFFLRVAACGAAFFGSLLPARAVQFALEAVWNWKKRNLFVAAQIGA